MEGVIEKRVDSLATTLPIAVRPLPAAQWQAVADFSEALAFRLVSF